MSPATRTPRQASSEATDPAPSSKNTELSGQALQEVYERVLRARKAHLVAVHAMAGRLAA